MSFTIIQSPNSYAASNNYMFHVVKQSRKPDWSFYDNQYFTSAGTYLGYLMYSGTTAHSFEVGDQVYVNQTAGYEWEPYTGLKTIVFIPNTKQIVVDQMHTNNTAVKGGTIVYSPPDNYYVQFSLYNADVLGTPIVQANIKTYPTIYNGNAMWDSHKVLTNYLSYDTNILSGKSDFYASTNMIYKYRLDYSEYTGSTLISSLTGATYGWALNAALDRNNNYNLYNLQMRYSTPNDLGSFLSPWSGDRYVRWDDRYTLSYLQLQSSTNYGVCDVVGDYSATYYLDNAYNTTWATKTYGRVLNLGCGPYEIENSSKWYGYYSTFSAITFRDSIAGNPPNFTFTFNPYYQIVTGQIITSDITDFLTKLHDIIETHTGFTCVTAVTSATDGTVVISAPTYYYGTTMTITNTAVFPMFISLQSSSLNITNTSTKYYPLNILSRANATSYTIHLENASKHASSYDYTFQIDTDCKLTDDEIQLIWLNNLGGFDAYTFYRQINKYYNRTIETYRKTDFIWNGSTLGTNEYDYGKNIISNAIDKTYKVKSKWLNNTMSENITEMFKSPYVFARINDTIYSVVINAEEIEVINNKNRDMAIYEISFTLSNQQTVQND